MLPVKEFGYLHKETQNGLVKLLADPNIVHVVEIGTLYGLSAKLIGNVLKPRTGRLWCVDPWESFEQLSKFDFAEVYEQFLANLQHWELANVVTPIKARSIPASSKFREYTLDMVYVDGDHSYWGVRDDIERWWPKLRSGGVLCGDDYTWTGLADGIADACKIVGASLAFTDVGFWRLGVKS